MIETKKLKEDATRQELVWIELVRAKNDDAKNHERAAKFTAMLARLGVAHCFIEFSTESGRFHKVDSCGSFLILEDDGHFFNLDYIANPTQP